LFKSLEQICQNHHIQTAIIISALGQLKNFELGFFKTKAEYLPQNFKKAHELLQLSGMISEQKSDYKFHLHAVLGDENKKTLGGHLISGTIETTGEIVLLKSNLKMIRKLEPKTGLEGLFLEND